MINREEMDEAIMKDWVKSTMQKGKSQIMLELYDYWKLMDVHSKVLDMITNGAMSKTGYTFEAIKEVYEEKIADLVEGAK